MKQAECPTGYIEVFSVGCQVCGKDCETYEQLHTGEDWEWWCYCKYCDIETFHLCFIPKNENDENSHR